jgi:colicin import membrane protein
MELTPDLLRPEFAVRLDQNLRDEDARARDQNNRSITLADRADAGSHFIIANEDRACEPQTRRIAVERGLLWILAASLTAHGLALLAAAWFDAVPADRLKEAPVEVVVETPATLKPAQNGGPAPLAQKAEPSVRPEAKAPAAHPESLETKLSRPDAADAKLPGSGPPETKPEKAKAASSKAAAAQMSEAQKARESKHAERKPSAQVKGSALARAAAQNQAASKIAAKTAAAREAGGPRTAGQWTHAGAQSSPSPAGVFLPFDTGPDIFRAVAVPLPVEGGDVPLSYKEIVFGLLERAKQYPQAARERGARGSAVVSFALDDAGELSDVSLVRSSGEADLDAESLALVARAAPFPKPPLGAQRAFAAEITFGLRRDE